MNKSNLSVVLPCFNEEENIKRIPDELLAVLERTGKNFEVVIVDDGSRDNTVGEAIKINDSRIKLIKHPRNMGPGQAMRTGINNAEGDLLITMDADFTFSPNYIPLFLENMERNPEVDFIIGSPMLGGYGKDIKSWRVVISKVANKFYNLLLGRKVTSINQFFRLYKTQQLKSLALESKGFGIAAEILFKLVFSGRKFIEMPVTLTQRIHGISHLNYRKEIVRHFFLVLKILKWKIFGFKN